MTLDELRRMAPGPDRIRAVGEYIANGEKKIAEARSIRDGDIRVLIAEHGPAEAARRSGLSLSTIKQVRGRS